MLKRLIKILWACILCSAVLLSCNNAPEQSMSNQSEQKLQSEIRASEDTNTEINFIPTEDNVKFLGRCALIDDKLVMTYSSTGAEFYVKAKTLKVTLTGDDYISTENEDNCARVIVLVNNERVIDEMILDSEKEYTVFEKDSVYEAVVRIIKVTDPSLSMAGIKKITTDKDGSICPTQKKDLKIEFIGDSITCAFGVDGNRNDENSSAKVEDSTKSYAYITAQNLGADYSLVAIPGWGVISGAASEADNYAKVDTNLIPLYYSKLSYSYWQAFGGKMPQEIDWDFSNFTPDVVAVNLGTNDSSYTRGDTEKIQEFIKGYKAFLTDIRSKNPDAHILCVLGTLGDYLYDAVNQAAAEYSASANDYEVSVLKLPQQIYSDGVGSLLHPSEITQKKTAAILTEKINSIILGKNK